MEPTRKGLGTLKIPTNEFSLKQLRLLIDQEFSLQPNKSSLHLEELRLPETKTELNFLFSQIPTINIHESFSKKGNDRAYLLPSLQIMRNYYPSPMESSEAWHTDCSGELRLKECRELLTNENYCFGKIGIYL